MQTQSPEADDQPLPSLRRELSLFSSALTRDAGNSWVIYDPAQHRYTQIDQRTYELLSLWPDCDDVAELKSAARARYGIRIDTADATDLIGFLEANGLVAQAPKGGWRYYASAASRRAQTQGILSRAAHNYLFFRVPLFQPHEFLKATLPAVSIFYTRAAFLLVVTLGAIGLYLTSRQWDEFIRTTDFFFTWQGAVCFGLALLTVKTAHELGHAYTAVRHGCFVPTMGVAFMLLTPLLYTDVTDSWKLREREKRLSIDAAGIVVELGIACIATFAWAFLPDGVMRSVAFTLATAGWIMSLAINLNPFMRFDGYYLLSEIAGIENLQTRAFAIAKWRLRELLFRPGRPCPEHLSHTMINWMTLWAWCTWIYRLVLFIGIAILVYTYCFKVLGIALFIIEIVFLVARPIWSELREWYEMRREIGNSRRTIVTAVITTAVVLLAALPWSGTVQVPATIEFSETRSIHSSRSALLTKVHVVPGQLITAGDKLFSLSSQELEQEIRSAEIELKLVALRIGRGNVDEIDRRESLVLRDQLTALRTKIAGLRAERSELELTAPISGKVLELGQEFHPGRWIKPTDLLALIGKEPKLEATGYVAEDDLWRISPGDMGRFVPDSVLGAAIDVQLRNVSVAGQTELASLSLTSIYGGPISVERNADRQLVPTRAQYLAKLDVVGSVEDHRVIARGTVHLKGRPESFMAKFWRHSLNVLVRESGA